jgi:hypothetical protein
MDGWMRLLFSRALWHQDAASARTRKKKVGKHIVIMIMSGATYTMQKLHMIHDQLTVFSHPLLHGSPPTAKEQLVAANATQNLITSCDVRS